MSLLFAALAIHGSAQRRNAEELYLWDANFKPTKNQESAVIIFHECNEN